MAGKTSLKNEFAFFNRHRDCSITLTLSSVHELSWSWISKNLIQVKKEKENFVVACLRCMMLHETIRNDDFHDC